MSINLSIRDYLITIAGLNCNNAVISFVGSDQKLDNASGLVTFKGTLILGTPEGGTFESLDDRVNDRWSRGNYLATQVADSSGSLRLLPRGGTLRILESAYDPKTRKLTLQVADVLELLRVREPIVNASKVCLGTNSDRTNVINNLLTAAGAPNLFGQDSVPGSISLPTAKLLEGSYIDQAAQIAAAAGYFLYTDTQGNVRAKAIDTANSATSFVLDAGSIVQTERVTGAAPPCELVIKGKAAVIKAATDTTESDDQQLGPIALAGVKPKTGAVPTGDMIIRETTIHDDFVRGAKRRTIQTLIKEPAGIVFAGDKDYAGVTDLITSSVVTDTYEYEQYSPIVGNSAASFCQQGNQGRLKKQTQEIIKPAGVVLKTVYASYPKKMQVDKTRLIVAEHTETDYTYSLSNSVDDFSDGYAAEWQIILGNGPRITVSKLEPIGAVDPDDFLYSAKKSLGNPDVLIQSFYTSTTFKERQQGEWVKNYLEYKPICVSDPEVAKLMRQQAKADRSQVALLVTRLRETDDKETISNAGQANPPAADTYSAIYSVTEKTAQIVLKLPVNAAEAYRQSRETLTFEYIAAVGQGLAAKNSAEAQCYALAQLWGAMLWGRYKSTSYTSDLGDDWWSYTPLCRLDVSEPETRFAYLGDGFSIAIAGKRCAVSFDGILLGQITQTPHVTPAVYDSQSVLVTPETTTYSDSVTPPFVRWMGLKTASGGAITLKRRSYDLTPISKRLEVASGGAIKGKVDHRVNAASGSACKGRHSTHPVRRAAGSAADLAKSRAWSELNAQRWRELSDHQYRKIISL